MHFATLVHKINLYMLEYTNIKHVHTIVEIIYSEKLMSQIIDFISNTDYFWNFGIRLLEHLWVHKKVRRYIEKSELFYVYLGLLRTNDNETLVSALSFMSVLLCGDNVEGILTKVRVLPLIVKLLKTKDIEYVYFISDIFMTILSDKSSKVHRRTLIKEGVIEVLQEIEQSEDFMMLPDLNQKWSKIRKELQTIKNLTAEHNDQQ